MEHEITAGTVLIKDDAPLPKGLHLESDPCVPDWKVVTNLDAVALDREIREIGWTFFCLAGETKTSVFGINHTKMVRKAIVAILTRKTSDRFNSLEILRLVFVGSARFPLVHHLALSTRWRHIQQGFTSLSVRNVSSEPVQAGDAVSPYGNDTMRAGDRAYQHQ